MKIDWSSFLTGCVFATVIWMLVIKFAWQPLVDSAQEVARDALAAADQSHKAVDYYHEHLGACIGQLSRASGIEVDPVLKEFFSLEPDEVKGKSDELRHRGE